jgi:hypothetical protein
LSLQVVFDCFGDGDQPVLDAQVDDARLVGGANAGDLVVIPDAGFAAIVASLDPRTLAGTERDLVVGVLQRLGVDVGELSIERREPGVLADQGFDGVLGLGAVHDRDRRRGRWGRLGGRGRRRRLGRGRRNDRTRYGCGRCRWCERAG